jgi:hypothetical protein
MRLRLPIIQLQLPQSMHINGVGDGDALLAVLDVLGAQAGDAGLLLADGFFELLGGTLVLVALLV